MSQNLAFQHWASLQSIWTVDKLIGFDLFIWNIKYDKIKEGGALSVCRQSLACSGEMYSASWMIVRVYTAENWHTSLDRLQIDGQKKLARLACQRLEQMIQHCTYYDGYSSGRMGTNNLYSNRTFSISYILNNKDVTWEST